MNSRYHIVLVLGLAACATEPSQESPQVGLASISAGVSATCAVSEAGALFCWGRVPWASPQETGPERVLGPGNARAVDLSDDAFNDFGCVTLMTYTPRCWGHLRRGNSRYELFSDTLRMLPYFPGVSDVAVSNTHVCALTRADSTAFCSLGFLSGVGGTGTTVADLFDTVPSPVFGGIQFLEIVAGDWVTCGLALSRLVYCWGRNTELGVSSPPAGQSDSTCWAWPCVNRPVPIELGLQFEQLTAGEEHACALGAAGVYCWGTNPNGETGQPGAIGAVTLSPARVPISGAMQVTAGKYHTCALTHGGDVLCWGWNNSGQLGRSTVSEADHTPRSVETSVRFKQVSAGGWHTCAISSDNEAYCWGWNASGQLGTGDTTNVSGIVRVVLD